jgi:hypothetical protein
MSDLTDAEKKSFIDKIIAALTTSKADLTAKGWDPAQRITNLQNGVTSVTNDEGIVAQLDAALAAAIATRRTDLDNNYALASASVSLVEGILGKDAPLVRDLRQIRGAFSQEAKPEPVAK